MPIPTPENAKLLAELMEQTALAADDNFLVSNISITKRTTFATVYNSLKNLYGVGYGIVETGSNTNGRWIKFSDGTMIQYGTIAAASTTFSTFVALYISGVKTITFPTSFINTGFSYSDIVTYPSGSGGLWTAQDNTLTVSTIGRYIVAPSSTTRTVGISWHAIGRWK